MGHVGCRHLVDLLAGMAGKGFRVGILSPGSEQKLSGQALGRREVGQAGLYGFGASAPVGELELENCGIVLGHKRLRG